MDVGTAPICITVTEPAGSVYTLVFRKNEIALGRSPENDVRFDSQLYGMISRRHARIKVLADGRIIFQDLGSTQGSFVGSRKLAKPLILQRDDAVTLGHEGPTVCISWPRGRITGQEGTHIQFHARNAPHFPLVFSQSFIERFNSYKKIGMGGFGEVWQADPIGGASESVAIKLMHPLFLDPEYLGTQDRKSLVRRFSREARIQHLLSQSGVPSTVNVHEWGDDPDRDYIYMIMEHIAGTPFEQLVCAKPGLAPHRVAAYMRDVASALHAAHNFQFEDENGSPCRGVIHRDVKPNNILINNKTDRAVLLDFGIASIMQGGERLTATSVTVGTHQFLPPEALKGGKATPATDLWGFSVTLYLALSQGRFPYRGETETELLDSIIAGRIIPIHGFRSSIPPAITEALALSLDPNPANRIQTADEWVKILEGVMDNAEEK